MFVMTLSPNVKKVLSVHAILALAFFASFTIGSVNPARADAAAGLPCKVQVATLKLCSARTDNYKACYNPDPATRELRTWLAMTSVRARSAKWVIVAGQSQFSRQLVMRRTTRSSTLPRRALLTITPKHREQVTEADFRVGDPSTFWGPLVAFTDPVTPTAGIKLTVRLRRSNGTELGHTVITYLYDAAIANAPAGSVEYNGPGGLWYVGSKQTQTDWELGSGAQC